MKKSEVFEQAMAICDEHKVPAKFKEELRELLEPKNAGRAVNLDEVTRKNKEGVITEIQCAISGVWLPANALNFYPSRDGKGVPGLDGIVLQRVSKQGEAIRKAHYKAVTASEKAIMDDVLNGALKPEDGKKKIAELKAKGPDYSVIKPVTKETEKSEPKAK